MSPLRPPLLLTLAALLAAGCAARAEDKGRGGALLPGANSREPVSIDAAKLDYFDKESKLVYSGEVVAKQGDSTLRASVLTIFLVKGAKDEGAKGESAAGAAGGGPASGSSIKRMEAKGPVTVVQKDEVGTGDNGSYDKADNRITLTGNVTLTQGTNVIKGDRLTYDMTSGQAQVSSGQTAGRVRSVFTPGAAGGPAVPGRKTAKPADAARKPAASQP